VIGWLEGLPTAWLIIVVVVVVVVVVVGTLLLTAAIHFVAMRLAAGPHGTAVRSVSPGLLSPMGLVFG
jgi:uncharacterized membrane protein AbrB (regulator of aidB expression)